MNQNAVQPSHNRQDYKDAEDRVRGYNDALEQYQGADLASFLNQYGHLLDDDEIIGQQEAPAENPPMGMSNIANLMNDDDDDIDLLASQMQNMYQEPGQH